MPKKLKISDDSAAIRRRAEAQLKDRRKGLQSKAGQKRDESETERLVQELEVHQIELELQNAELREARAQLELSLERFTDLYDFAPVGYLTLDHELVIREINLAGASLLGIDRSALVNRKFGPFVSVEDKFALGAFFQKVYATKIRQRCEVTLKSEGHVPLDVSMDAIALVSGQQCRVTLMDITERKRVEANHLILDKLESAGILAGGIAHDFNNLLTVLVLNIEMAQMLNPSDETLAGHLEDARKTTLLAKGLTTQLLTLSEGGVPIRSAVFLSGLIQESVRLALIASNVRSEFALAENLWATEVDAGQIGQVFRNIILNARDAMPRGGVVSLHAENVVLDSHEQPLLPSGEYVRLSIKDNGTGIAKDVLPKIFDPYFSTKKRGTQKGMGLGLTICHAVVKKHGGAVVAESTPGTGTTFHIYLPAVPKVSRKEPVSAVTTIPPRGRLLVMDDEEAIRKVLGLTLQRMGLEVELVEDGQSAIDAYKQAKAQKRPFDAVILDLTVHRGMGGREAMRALLRLDRGVKCIVMSGYSNEPVILEHEPYGFKGTLTKPFNREQLLGILSRVLQVEGKA